MNCELCQIQKAENKISWNTSKGEQVVNICSMCMPRLQKSLGQLTIVIITPVNFEPFPKMPTGHEVD